MTQMEQENVKLRALLEQVKQDLEPALAILSEDKGVIGLDSRCTADWFVGLAYVQCFSIEELLK